MDAQVLLQMAQLGATGLLGVVIYYGLNQLKALMENLMRTNEKLTDALISAKNEAMAYQITSIIQGQMLGQKASEITSVLPVKPEVKP